MIFLSCLFLHYITSDLYWLLFISHCICCIIFICCASFLFSNHAFTSYIDPTSYTGPRMAFETFSSMLMKWRLSFQWFLVVFHIFVSELLFLTFSVFCPVLWSGLVVPERLFFSNNRLLLFSILSHYTLKHPWIWTTNNSKILNGCPKREHIFLLILLSYSLCGTNWDEVLQYKSLQQVSECWLHSLSS